MKISTYNNITFKTGQSDEENWKLIKYAHKDYYWIHADSVPSAHVIIEIDKPLENEILYACTLCKEQTKITDESTQYIITQINNIKLGNNVGEVIIKDSTRTKKYIIHK